MSSISAHDKAYQYDHVGRLSDAHTGAEARAHLQYQGATPDGPYSHAYRYDEFGNMTFAFDRFLNLPAKVVHVSAQAKPEGGRA